MTLTYTTYVSQLSNLMVIPSTDSNFTTFLPGCIDYAEQRIYRELDLLHNRIVDATGNFTVNSRDYTLPTGTGTFIVVESINAISSGGNRTPMVPVTKEWLDAVYPNATISGTPAYFAPITDTAYIVGPSAVSSNITAEVIGVIRPTPLSSTNTSTFLTTYCPDLFMAASMIFATAYQRDFGAESEDPKASASWEQQYQNLLASAAQEQQRTKFEGAAWTPMINVPIQPPRA